MTSTTTRRTRNLLPSCPPWCDGLHRGGIVDWDELTDGSGFIRSHSGGDWGCLRNGAGRYVVGVYVGVNEHDDGTFDPAEISLDLSSRDPGLTAEQARTLARYLTEAADLIEAHR